MDDPIAKRVDDRDELRGDGMDDRPAAAGAPPLANGQQVQTVLLLYQTVSVFFKQNK